MSRIKEETHYAGFAAIVGRPNVGKSTLVNRLIGEKIAIMSEKAQTTRNKITCISNMEKAQIVFLDTPGIHKPQHKLGEYMVRIAESTLKEVDVVLFVIDASEKQWLGDEYILNRLKKVKTPVILVVNKIDKLQDKRKILQIIESYRKSYDFAAVVPVSALEDKEFPQLTDEILKYLPEGAGYFPEDMITDQPERILAAETIREKILQLTRDEVQHSVAVEVLDFKERENGSIYISANIYVERESQKGIIIGVGGSMLKKIGAKSRSELENFLGNKVYLELWVKVRADWRNRENDLRDLGYK